MSGVMNDYRLAFKITRRELRSGLKGFYIFLLCLVLGVGTIASVRSLSQGLLKTIEADGQYILGGDIALRTIYEPAPKEQVDFLRKNIGLTTVIAETRAMARHGITDQATLVELKAVDVFYPLYGSFDYRDENGNIIQAEQNVSAPLLPPEVGPNGEYIGDWGAFIEEGLSETIGVQIGDPLVIGEQKFIIRGLIVKEPDRLGSERFTYAPRVMIAKSGFEYTGLLQEGSQIYYDHKVILWGQQRYEQLGDIQKKINDAFPDATWKGRNYFNASPTIERFIERLTLFLSLVGLTSLLVGGVGIGNAVKVYLEQKYKNIAVLKCLGGPRHLIFKVYFLQILFMGVIGIAIGCLLGGIIPLGIAPLLTAKLSLSSNYVSIYPDELLIAAIFGFLTVAGFALLPIGKACEVKAADLFRSMITVTKSPIRLNVLIGLVIVLQALILVTIMTASDRGLALAFVIGSILTMIIFMGVANILKGLLKTLRHLPNTSIRFAVSNLYRPGNNTNSLILSLGLGLTVCVAIGLIEYNFSHRLQNNINADAPSFFFLDIQKNQVEGFSRALNKTPTARDLRLTPQLRGRVVKVNDIPAEQALVNKEDEWVMRGDRGFTYTNTLPDNSTIIAGEWWPENYVGAPIISIAQDVANAFEIGVGDTITVNILGFDITATVANVRQVDWASFSMNFAITFAPGPLNDAPATFLATVKVDEDQEIAMQSMLAKSFPNISAVRIRDALNLANRLLKGIAQAVTYSAMIAVFAGVFVLAGAIAAGQKRRIYDAVVFKVIGIRRRQMMSVFLMEYIILGLMAALVAGGLGTLCAWAIQSYLMDLEWIFDIFSVLWILSGAFMIAVLFGLLATWHHLNIAPAKYLRNE